MYKISWQYIKKNINNTFALLLCIVVSTILLVGVTSTLKSMQINKSQYYAKQTGNYQYKYRIENESYKNIEKKIENSKADVDSWSILSRMYSIDKPKYFDLYLCDRNFFKQNNIKLLKGRYPNKKGEMLIEEWSISNMSLTKAINSSMKFQGKKYKIVGIVSDSYMKTSNTNVGYTFVDVEEPISPKYEVNVNFDYQSDILKESKTLKDEFKVSSKNYLVNRDTTEALGYYAASEDESTFAQIVEQIASNEKVIAILFAVFGCFITYSVLNIILTQRMRQYGILVTLGATKYKLFRIIFNELLTLLIVGYSIGAVVGFYGSKILFKLRPNDYIVSQSNIFILSKNAISIGFAIYLILIVVMSYIITYKINKKTLLNSFGEISKHLKKKRIILSSKKRDLIPSIFSRYRKMRPVSFACTIISLALCGVILCGSNYYFSTIKEENKMRVAGGDEGLAYDYAFKSENNVFDSGLKNSDLDRLKKVDGIKNIYAFKQFMGETKLHKKQMVSDASYKEANKDKRLKGYFNGILNKDLNNNYLLKGDINGYDEDMLEKEKMYLETGKIDKAKLDTGKYVIVIIPVDGATGATNTILNIKAGDILEVKTPKLQNQNELDILTFKGDEARYETKKLTVLATVRMGLVSSDYWTAGNGLDLIMSNKEMENLYGISKYDIACADKTEDVDSAKLANDVQEVVKDVPRMNFQDNRTQLEEQNASLRRQENLIDVLAISVILISIFNMLNSMRHMFSSRKKEIGIIRAIGTNEKKILRVMAKEGAIYGIYTNVCMILGIYIVTNLMCQHLKSVCFLYHPVVKYDLKAIVFIAIINLVVSIFTAIVSIKKVLSEHVVTNML